jgi:uncharacterized protein YciI
VRELEPHTFVLLRRRADAPDFSDERGDELQAAHLAFLDAQRETGVMLAAGPFRDQADETLRGLCVYAVPLEEAKAIAATDPWVVAGALAADPFTWLAPPGQARFGRH